MKCPICLSKMDNFPSNKKYCHYRCQKKFNALKKKKELFRLSDEDKLIHIRLKKEGLI